MTDQAYAIHATSDAKEKLVLLMRGRKGAGQAIKKAELLAILWGEEAAADKSYNNKYDRSLREMIEEINQEGGLICSSPRTGYWWAESLDDGLPAAEALKRRALTQLGNANRLVENIQKEYGGQLSLFSPSLPSPNGRAQFGEGIGRGDKRGLVGRVP